MYNNIKWVAFKTRWHVWSIFSILDLELFSKNDKYTKIEYIEASVETDRISVIDIDKSCIRDFQ